jgi:uncharacterized membrane-anchored protein YhcB (DUF1043 family)
MWYLVIIAFVIGFIAGVMFGRHNKSIAIKVDDGVDDLANKVSDKTKDGVSNFSTSKYGEWKVRGMA